MENKITIGFNYGDEEGSIYSSCSTVPVFPSLGERPIDVIGEQMNHFLRQMGYIRPNNNMLMEDLSDEEYDAVCCFLSELRNQKEEELNDDADYETEG